MTNFLQPADLKDLIDSFVNMPLDKLPDALNQFSIIWDRPRGDLCLWASLLNRHDEILKDLIAKYGLEQGKIKPQYFDTVDEKLISAIMNFTALVLSNSSNRGIFASDKYIYTFLYCTSPVLVAGALKVCVTLSLHHIHSKFMRTYLPPPEVNVISKYATIISSIRPELSFVEYYANHNPPPDLSVQYYVRTSGPSSDKNQSSRTTDQGKPMGSPIESAVSKTPDALKEGLTEYIISSKDVIEVPLHEYLQRVFNTIPEEYWLDVVFMTFVAKSSARTDEGVNLRTTLIEMQCDALKIAGYAFPPAQIDIIFSEHPNIIRHLCQLLLPESNIPQKLKIAGTDTFCSIVCQPSIAPDIVIALSSHVNHGPLMIILRNLLKEMKKKHDIHTDFIDGLTSLVLQLSHTANTSTMVTLTPEFIPILMELITLGSYLPNSRGNTVDSLNHLLNDAPTNISFFLQECKGSEFALQLFDETVEKLLIPANQGQAPKYSNVDYSIDFFSAQLLKNVLHLIGTVAAHGKASDRIQIVLESKFIPLTKNIVLNPKIFGSRNIILALGILGNMIENESSALQALCEKDHMDVILKAIPDLLAYSTSFHSPIAKFYNSLFHHELGLNLNEEKGFLQEYFLIITNHINGKDSLRNLGATFDQICTEHSSLRPLIISESIKLIEALRKNLDHPLPDMHFFKEMEYVDDGPTTDEDINVLKTYSLLVSAINFIDGLLKNAHSQVEFIKQKGVSSILCFFELGCLNYDFTFNSPAMTLCQTLKQLFDLDVDRDYVGNEIISHFEKAISRVEEAEKNFDVNGEEDILESPVYKRYLKSLSPLNNIIYAFYITVFTNYGTGFRIRQLLEKLGEGDIGTSLISRLGKIQRQAIWEDSRITQHISASVRDATRAVSLDDIYGSTMKRLQETEDVKKLKELEIDLKEDGKTSRFYTVKSGRFLLNGIIFSVSMFYYVLSNSLTRDFRDGIHFIDKTPYKLLEAIAESFVDHFNRVDLENLSEIQIRFLVDALTCLQKVMYRPVGSIMTLFKGVFIFFKQLGGIMTLVKILAVLFERPEANKDDSNTAGAVKVLLVLTHYMVSADSVIDTRGIAFRTWGQKDEKLPNFFSLPQFFLECKLTVFNTMVKIWYSESLLKKPSSITNLVITLMTSIFSQQAEDLLPKTNPSRLSYISWSEACPSETLTKTFTDMGFEPKTVEAELIKCRNDPILTFGLLNKNSSDDLEIPTINYPSPTPSVPNGPQGLLLTVDDLKSLRQTVFANALSKSLLLLHEHPDNVFIISTFISQFIPSKRPGFNTRQTIPLNKTAINEIIMVICSIDLQTEENNKSLATYCHLLGLLLFNKTTFYFALENMIEHLPTFVELIEKPDASSKEWFSHVLLILELVLTAKDVPEPISTTEFVSRLKTYNEFTIPETAPISEELYERVFLALTRIEQFSDEMTTVSVARLFVFFTRDFKRAEYFKKSPIFLKLVKTISKFSLSKKNSGIIFSQLKTMISTILRHTVETPTVVRNIIRNEIFSYFKTRHTTMHEDLYAFLNHRSSLVGRSPELFIEVMREICMLSQPGEKNSSSIILKGNYDRRNALYVKQYKEIEAEKVSEKDKKKTEDSDVSMDDAPILQDESVDSTTRPIESSQSFSSSATSSKIHYESSGVIQLLINELLSLKAEDIFLVPEKTEFALRQYLQQNSQKKEKSKEKVSNSKADFHYIGFLLQSLTELVGSYSNCRLEFINYSKKTHSTSGPLKPRATILNHFLNEFLPCGVLGSVEAEPFQEWSEISLSATLTILNLVTTTKDKVNDFNLDEDEVQSDTELTLIRKFVIDVLARAFKDVRRSSEPLDWRYSKLTVFSDLCYKMMSSKASRPHSASSTDFQGVSIADGAAVAKIIYDKNFAPILTGALADIDLNFPDAKRPIRSLTRSLNKISRLTMEIPDEPKTNDSLEDDYDQHLIEVNSEFEEEDDETIPDIFRNSALGMFEAGEAIYEFDDDIEVEEQSDSEMAGASEEDELSFDDDAQSDVNGTESEAFDDIMYQDADVAQTSSDDDLSNSEDEDEDEDDNDDSEDEEVERLIIETEIPHDHEMEDADLSGSENSDWESYEEGEENESQIEAVETILQQQDEGGLEIRQILSRQSLDDIDDDDDLEDDIDHGRRRMPTANDAETLPDEFLTEYEYDDDDDDDDDDNDNDDHHGLGRGIGMFFLFLFYIFYFMC